MSKANPNIPVEEILGIPARIMNVCKQHGLATLQQVAEQPAIFWMSQRNIGKGQIQKLADVLIRYGMTIPGAVRFGIITETVDSVELSDLPGIFKTTCRHLGIKTVHEVSMMSKKQWLRMRNIGPKNVKYAEAALHKQGLAFAE